ncbi:MAG: hypothetical protein ACT4R6_03820, partial [Gemmatimonadaceae bacterium]
ISLQVHCKILLNARRLLIAVQKAQASLLVEQSLNARGQFHNSRVSAAEATPDLPPPKPVEIAAADYRMTGLSLNGHPMKHLREVLAPNGIRTAKDLCATGAPGGQGDVGRSESESPDVSWLARAGPAKTGRPHS